MVTSGKVLYGINNIFSVLTDEKTYICRIKGKVLKGSEGLYNPIAAGDVVDIETDPHSRHSGVILGLRERKNALTRWNRKRMAVQLIASNIDTLFCMTTPAEPPFRPRFLDRLLLTEYENINKIILVNKSDLEISGQTQERLSDFERIGYRVIMCSAVTGEGLEEVNNLAKTSVCAFAGQSGVGKSTVINIITGKQMQKTGEISKKYDRGRHTTNYSIMIPHGNGAIIDTPGIRDIFIKKTAPQKLSEMFPEIKKLAGKCLFSTCSHIKEEDCAVKRGIEQKKIHQDRYMSYVKLYLEMTEQSEEVYGPAYT